MTEGSSIPVPNSTQFLSRRMQLQKYSTDDLLTMTTVTTGADSLNHDRSTDCYSQSNKHPINCTTTTKPTGEDEGLAWSWSSSSAHDPRQRNYTCYKTRHNLSIRTYDYWHRPSEWRLSSEYSVLILFTIRILYQSLRKLCRSEIFSLFLNLFVSFTLAGDVLNGFEAPSPPSINNKLLIAEVTTLHSLISTRPRSQGALDRSRPH